MKPFVITLPLLLGALVSCDKAKQAVEAVREKVGGVADPGAPLAPGGEISSGLASQVDSAAEGVRFRRDLPFPGSLRIRVVERQVFQNARIVARSALGRETAVYNGTWERLGGIVLGEGRLEWRVDRCGEVLLVKEGEAKGGAGLSDKGPRPAVGEPMEGLQVEFERGPKGWSVPSAQGAVEFRKRMLGQQLGPALPVVLAAHGVMPRTQWFSSTRRWISGDEFMIAGESLALLFPGAAVGKVGLIYEESEALDGHPCGRFAVEGDLALKGDVAFSGESSDREISIRSGKVWCSLLYPLVLREEYQTVQTILRGSGSGPRTRIQGAVEHVVSRQWQP
jgi:hypothetical protein